jgi:hypothetical protein
VSAVSDPPRTYAAWAALLDRFAAGDDEVVAALEAGSLEWTGGVAERFTRRVVDALEARMQAWHAALSRDLAGARGDPQRVGQALVAARPRIASLFRVAALGVLPENVRKHLGDELARLLATAQSSLEGSVARHPGALALVRRHSLTARFPGVPTPEAPAPAEPAPPPSTFRKILF